ncbi:hypothetical protein [Methylobacterium frigidaeris]|uniref:hypothetical protein n=1 Tax=Methylobacterium frigidaeris TaxID=2038277 RepID=UPI001EDDD3AE|nr:hypothetical protein [Methylobacterium frigidaeris]
MPGSPEREAASPATHPDAAVRPAGAGVRRWLLDTLLVGLAHGGCIHGTHPDYVAFLRDLGRSPRR